MGQNRPTRNWTAGFSLGFSMYQVKPFWGYRIFDHEPFGLTPRLCPIADVHEGPLALEVDPQLAKAARAIYFLDARRGGKVE